MSPSYEYLLSPQTHIIPVLSIAEYENFPIEQSIILFFSLFSFVGIMKDFSFEIYPHINKFPWLSIAIVPSLHLTLIIFLSYYENIFKSAYEIPENMFQRIKLEK